MCRRGHVQAYSLKEEPEPDDLGKCSRCGADVRSRCTNCGLRIRGRKYRPRVVSASGFSPPPFCDGCGAAHPWATRDQRLYELQNILDQEEIDDVDRLWIDEQMDRLRADDGTMTDKQQKDIWLGVKKRAPGLFDAAGKALLGGVISAGVRAMIGV